MAQNIMNRCYTPNRHRRRASSTQPASWTTLARTSQSFAREKGARYVNLFVDPTNRRAIALYHRVGFVEVDERDQVIEMRINLTKRTKEQ